MAKAQQRDGLALVGLVAILLAFGVLGVAYSLQVPLFEAPDEPAHYRYVRYLVDERNLPPLVVSEDEWIQGEFHQPPLYYILGALTTVGIESDVPLDSDPAMARNPYAKRGLPHEPDNKNAMLHLATEHPLASPLTQSVYRLRWLGLLLSCGTLTLLWATAKAILPDRPYLVLLTTAITALNPQFVFASAAANNDSLVTLFATATLYLLVRVIQEKARPWRTPLAIGLVIGAAGLTKLSGLALAALVPVAYGATYWLRRWQRQDTRFTRDLGRPVLIVAVIIMAVCGWWYLRNGLQFDDPFGMRSYRRIFQVFGDPLPWGESLALLMEAFVSYWGVFGWMNVLTFEVYYLAMRIICIFAAGGLALRLIDRLHQHKWSAERWLPLGLLAVWVLIMLGLLYRWTQTITRTQGRLMFPAATGVSLFLVLGLDHWFSGARSTRRVRMAAATALLLLLGGMSAAAPVATILPTYQHPKTISLEDVPTAIHGLDIAYGDDLVLLGYELSQDQVSPDEWCHLRLYWLCRTHTDENLTVYAHLFGRDGQRIGTLDTFPGLGNYPTSLWVPGEVVIDDTYVHIDASAEAPVAAEIRVGVYHTDSMDLLSASSLGGEPVSPAPTIGRIRVMPHLQTLYRPANAIDAQFGEQVTLIGGSLTNNSEPGTDLEVRLFWRCEQAIQKDYTVFLHVVDESNDLVAQDDGQPLGGEYPTSYWAPGQEIEDVRHVMLPANLAPGRYELHVGLYSGETGQRLPILNTDSLDNALILDHIMLEGEGTP